MTTIAAAQSSYETERELLAYILERFPEEELSRKGLRLKQLYSTFMSVTKSDDSETHLFVKDQDVRATVRLMNSLERCAKEGRDTIKLYYIDLQRNVGLIHSEAIK